MERPIGKYVVYREEYLKEVKPAYYAELVESGELNEHLAKIKEQAFEMKERIIEGLKAKSEEWQRLIENGSDSFYDKLRLLNQFEAIADEQIYQDIIYA